MVNVDNLVFLLSAGRERAFCQGRFRRRCFIRKKLRTKGVGRRLIGSGWSTHIACVAEDTRVDLAGGTIFYCKATWIPSTYGTIIRDDSVQLPSDPSPTAQWLPRSLNNQPRTPVGHAMKKLSYQRSQYTITTPSCRRITNATELAFSYAQRIDAPSVQLTAEQVRDVHLLLLPLRSSFFSKAVSNPHKKLIKITTTISRLRSQHISYRQHTHTQSTYRAHTHNHDYGQLQTTNALFTIHCSKFQTPFLYSKP